MADAIDIEATWNKAVRRLQGIPLSEFVDGPMNFENADYIFPHDKVLAELKILEHDRIREPHMVNKVSALYREELRLGRAPPVAHGPTRMTTAGFSGTFKQRVSDQYRKRVEKDLLKANRQIKETKDALSLLGFRGLVLMVNEKNSSIDPENAEYLIKRTLNGRHCSAINEVIYLTANLKATYRKSKQPFLVWLTLNGKLRAGIDGFSEMLQTAWFAQLSVQTGEPVAVYDGQRFVLGDLKNQP